MDAPFDEYVFPEPWWDLRGSEPREAEQRDHLVQELRAELGPEHPLATHNLAAVAAFTRQDEVLFRLSGDEFAVAHLTQAGKPDPFIRVRSFATWTAARAEVETMASDW